MEDLILQQKIFVCKVRNFNINERNKNEWIGGDEEVGGLWAGGKITILPLAIQTLMCLKFNASCMHSCVCVREE